MLLIGEGFVRYNTSSTRRVIGARPYIKVVVLLFFQWQKIKNASPPQSATQVLKQLTEGWSTVLHLINPPFDRRPVVDCRRRLVSRVPHLGLNHIQRVPCPGSEGMAQPVRGSSSQFLALIGGQGAHRKHHCVQSEKGIQEGRALSSNIKVFKLNTFSPGCECAIEMRRAGRTSRLLLIIQLRTCS